MKVIKSKAISLEKTALRLGKFVAFNKKLKKFRRQSIGTDLKFRYKILTAGVKKMAILKQKILEMEKKKVVRKNSRKDSSDQKD